MSINLHSSAKNSYTMPPTYLLAVLGSNHTDKRVRYYLKLGFKKRTPPRRKPLF